MFSSSLFLTNSVKAGNELNNLKLHRGEHTEPYIKNPFIKMFKGLVTYCSYINLNIHIDIKSIQ